MPGFYDGDFVGYRVPSSDEIGQALREAVVAIDANVLFSLYRFRSDTARDLLEVLQRFGDRLVVPHQAVREFWRHRQRAAASPNTATGTALETIEKSVRSMTQMLGTWGKQVGLDPAELAGIVDRVESFSAELREELLTAQGDVGAVAVDDDPILHELERLLEGRVTDPLVQSQWEECVAEGRRRVEAHEPPGYKDAGKEDGAIAEGPAGDYLVWYQAITYAREQDRDLLIVTADEKEDWWWRQQGALIGPRPELTLEYYRLTGRRLFLLRPSDILARAGELEVEVSETSVSDADRHTEGGRAVRRWTESAFFAEYERRNPIDCHVARQLLDWASPIFAGIRWGYGRVDGSFYPRLFPGRPQSLFVVYTNGSIEIRFGSIRELPPFEQEEELERLRMELNGITGWELPPVSEKSYPSRPIAPLRRGDALTKFMKTMEHAARQIWARA